MKLKLPYKLRDNQEETISSIKATIGNRNHIVLESPTGSGKTQTLYSILDYLQRDNINISTNAVRVDMATVRDSYLPRLQAVAEQIRQATR